MKNIPIISAAPMMGWTDRHERYFLRLISPHSILYTEMVTAAALTHGDASRFLAFHADEQPLVLQLGGSDPKQLAQGAKLAGDAGFREINLNVGCPSDRVQAGRFGACLMKEPELVAECATAMQANVAIPVTIKTRIGVDDCDSYENLYYFINLLKNAGVQHIIIHARKAWLNGLSPKENRTIPPLRYELVHQIKRDFPDLIITVNGGIKTLEQVIYHANHVDGIMIGRESYHNPYFLAELEQYYYAEKSVRTRTEVIQHYVDYMSFQLKKNNKLSFMARHMLSLFCGQPGARAWRRSLTQTMYTKNADPAIILDALKCMCKEL